MTTAMPTSSHSGGETNILDEILSMLEGNGDITREMRDKLMLKAFAELIRKTDKIERESPISYLRRYPVRIAVLATVIFVLMHEFATYVNIGVLLTAAARMLGVPIS